MDTIRIDQLEYSDILEQLDAGMSPEGTTVHFIYPSDFSYTSTLRMSIKHICEYFGLPSQWVSRMVLMVDELNNNAIEHGSSDKNQSNEMKLVISKDIHTIDLTIEVQDSGTGSHPKTASQMQELRTNVGQTGFENHHSIRGRGLFLIIERLVDELYFRDVSTGGLLVGFSKKISLNSD